VKRSLGAVLAACCLGACGIGSSDTVEEIQPDELAVLDPTSSTSTTMPDSVPPVESTPGSVELVTTTIGGTTTTVATEDVPLYFISGSQLMSIATPVPLPLEERRILDALASGPPAAELEAGIRNAVPLDLVRGVRQVGHRITIDLRGDVFRGIDSDDQRLTVAQIVLTMTDVPGIDEVVFTTDGEPLRVYQRDNELTEPGEPVTSADYVELLDGSRSTTATTDPIES
jgi:spore germination protein GerM